MKKILAALLLTLPSMAMAIDLDGYYITAKGGAFKTFNIGTTGFTNATGNLFTHQNDDLGTGTAFGFSVGKYLTDSFRLELEAIKRTGYEYDAESNDIAGFVLKGNVETKALFINALYDFQPFSISNKVITPYLGGGLGISRNKLAKQDDIRSGVDSNLDLSGSTSSEFAYKLAVGSLISLTEQLSLDVNYQYVNLGEFEGGNELTDNPPIVRGINGGDIKTQELMVGLQYTFK